MAPRVLLQFIVVLSAFCAVAIAGKNYFEVLQVPKGASDAQIKRAYRKLALQYHPDKVTGSDAEKEAASKRFAEIGVAYEVLSNEEKRKIYERYGEEGLKQHEAQGGGGGGGGGDIFSQFFGGGFGFGGGQEEEDRIPKGHDVYIDLEVTLKDLYLGNSFMVTRDKNVIKPAKGKRQCNCKNKMVTRQLGPGMYQQYTTQECDSCPNVKFGRESEVIAVHVEPGMTDKQEIPFFEEGEPMVDGEAGDLKFVIRTLPHPQFVRKGNNLLYNMTIPLVDALVGFSSEISHLDGHKVVLSASGVTIPGQVQKLKGEGMPLFDHPNKRGDLYVTYTVRFPKSLSETQKALVREHFKPAHDEL